MLWWLPFNFSVVNQLGHCSASLSLAPMLIPSAAGVQAEGCYILG